MRLEVLGFESPSDSLGRFLPAKEEERDEEAIALLREGLMYGGSVAIVDDDEEEEVGRVGGGAKMGLDRLVDCD